MTCPNCHDSDHIELDTHAEGFAANIQECGACGTVWSMRDNTSEVIRTATHRHGLDTNECPICHSIDHVEIDIHADGFARNLEECGVCGALWSQDGRQTRLVHGATWA
jgi:Zn ribbon nucleic-acid-binding protein